MKRGITALYTCYLTDKAKAAVEELKTKGLDEDLAVATLELLWGEESIYELPDRDTTTED